MEVADNFVRLDRSLAHFLDALERRFGNRVVVALTADHGVQPNPEIVKLRDPKADAGRIDIRCWRSLKTVDFWTDSKRGCCSKAMAEGSEG